MELIERTLVLLKPDAVTRGLVGRLIRFEDAGLKIAELPDYHTLAERFTF